MQAGSCAVSMLSRLLCVCMCVCVCVYGGRLLCRSECWSALGSGDVTHCDVTRGGDGPRWEAVRTDRQRNYTDALYSSPAKVTAIACVTSSPTSFKSENIFFIIYLFFFLTVHVKCTALSPSLTSTAISGCHGNSHGPNQLHSSNTHTHTHTDTITTSPS